MPKDSSKGHVLTRYIERSVLVGLGLALPAVALLILSAVVGEALGVILATIGGAILTIALLSFLYDPFLKDLLAQEIFDRLEIRESVSKAGLRDIIATREVALAPLLVGARKIDILPYDPIEWARDEYRALLGLARQNSLEINVYLPAADDPFVEVLSDRLRMGEAEVRSQLNSLALEFGQAWDSEPRHSEAKLFVWRFTGLPGAGLLLSEPCAVVEIGPALRYPVADRTTLSLIFEGNAEWAEWITRQLAFTPPEERSLIDERPLQRSDTDSENAAITPGEVGSAPSENADLVDGTRA
jgi:hypothetical protein